MIRYVKSQQVDRAAYRDALARDAQELPYAQPWFLDAVCEGWDALVWDDYKRVWPLPRRRKGGINYYFRPTGVQQLGIFGTMQDFDAEDLITAIRTLPKEIRFMDVCLNEGQEPISGNTIPGLSTEKRLNLVLPLSSSYAQIYRSFNQNLKRKIKKGAKQKLEIFEHDGPEVLMTLFEQNQGKRLKLSAAYYRDMKKLLYQLIHLGLGRIFTVYGGPNMLLAGAFFLQQGKRQVFLFSALSDMGKEQEAMAYLLNEYVIYQSGKAGWLDFEGSEAPGLAQFYRSFGSEERYYWRVKLNRLPWPLNWLKN